MGAIEDVVEIRLLPPLAIARLGSSPEPMHNYDILPPADGEDHRRLAPAPTLRIEDGRIVAEELPAEVRFRDDAGRIRPVSPFLEVWARFAAGEPLQPLTAEHLAQVGLGPADVVWRVDVANLKAFRRTGDPRDRIEAGTGEFSDHSAKALTGECPVFKAGKSIPFGNVQFIEPTAEFPDIRLRFVPAAGKVYGPRAGDPNLADDVYDAARGGWDNHADGDPGAPPPTAPGGIYRGRFNSQTQRFVSEGYLDDACDGVVEVALSVAGKTLRSQARITAGPPDFAPDSYHVRTLEDELEQMLRGPEVRDPVPWGDVTDLLRRASETVSLMDTRVMNGTQGLGGVAQNGNNMAGHDAGTGRAFEPIFDPDVPGLTDPAAVRGFHRGVLQGLEAGTLPTFLELLRPFDEAHNLTNAARRRMPAMMRGSDGGHLALTRRQRDKVRAAAGDDVTGRPGDATGGEATAEEEMVSLIQHFAARASLHMGLDAGGGNRVGDLFPDPAALLDFLRSGAAQGSLAGPETGRPLVVAGNPDDSALVRLLRRPDHPMHSHFSRPVPGSERTGLEIVEQWILSLT